MLINESEFERIVTEERDRKFAKIGLEKGKFDTYTIVFNRFEMIYTIEAFFRARYYKNHIVLKVDQLGNVVQFDCDCPYCSPLSGCEHVGTVLLKTIQLSKVQIPYVESGQALTLSPVLPVKNQFSLNDRQATQMIQLYKKRFDESTQFIATQKKVGLHLVLEELFGYSRDRHLAISFKIGTDKLYIIKNLDEFFEHLQDSDTVSYGKSLSFMHTREAFDEEALRQIQYLQSLHNSRNYFGEKYRLIEENELDSFFDFYKTISYEASGLIMQEEKLTIYLTVDQDNDGNQPFYIFRMESELIQPYLGKKHLYEIKSGKIIRYEGDEAGKCIDLYKHFTREKSVTVSQSQLDDFYKYVLSDLEEYVIIEGLEEELYEVQEENYTLYGDLDETGEICITVNCFRNGQKVYAFDPNQHIKTLKMERIESILEFYAERVDQEVHQVFFSSNSEKAWQFSQEVLPELAKYCEIFVSEALRTLGNVHKIDIKVGISFSENFLELDLDSFDMDKDEIMDVLKAYRRKKKYHRLKNGQLLSLNSNELSELSDMMDDLGISSKDFNGTQIKLPSYRAFTLEQMAESQGNLEFERKKPFDTFLEQFKKNSLVINPLPPYYDSILRDYQKEGVEWLKKISGYGFGGILADDMGLGKTIQMIAYLESEKQKGRVSLIVCPSSLLLNWQDEIKKFGNRILCLPILGSAQTREMLIRQIEDVDVAIISYDYLRRDIELLKEKNFYAVVLDEAQYIKNQKTRNALCVKQLNAEHRFALTGTPIENSLAELWSIFDFLMPSYLYSYHYFLENFEKSIVKENDEEASHRLKKLVEPFILRRNKSEVLTELPDKIENTYTMSFTDEERKLYLANLAQVNDEIQKKAQMNQVDRIEILAMLMRLRQICCEPRMIYENIHHASSKLKGCMELIQALRLSRHKVLLFSSFTSALDLIGEECQKEGISYLKLTGKTDKNKRREMIEQFQKDTTEVFLISLKAGGTGLNLTAAHAVIHYDPWWNISAQNQATDRAYRMGQEHNVQVFKLIMKDTIEEKIIELQLKKKNLADAFVEDSEGSISRLSVDEITDLLKI